MLLYRFHLTLLLAFTMVLMMIVTIIIDPWSSIPYVPMILMMGYGMARPVYFTIKVEDFKDGQMIWVKL